MSVRPTIFLYAKNTQNLGDTGPPVPLPVFISMASDQLLSPAERAVTVGGHIAIRQCVRGVCAHPRERVCTCASVRVCVRA